MSVGQVRIAGEAGQEANPGNIRASGHGFGSCRTYCQMGSAQEATWANPVMDLGT